MSTRKNHNVAHPKALGVAAIVAVIIGILFLLPFFGVIVTAIVLAFSFSPVNDWFARRTKRPSSAPMLTLATAFLAVILPLLLIIGVTGSQTRTLATDLQATVATASVDQSTDEAIEQLGGFLETASAGVMSFDQEQLITYASTAGAEIANGLLRLLTNIITGIPGLISAVILFLYVFLAILRYQKELVEFLRKLNPLGDDAFDLYLKRAGAMTNGMVRGQLVIAIIQGALGVATFAIAGVPYLGFFFLLLSFLSIIPLGSGIISLPVGIIMLLMGNIWQGLVITLGHLLVVGNVDNVLRPYVIPKEARLPSVLVLLGVFAGLAIFGFLGLIIGPVILILLLTTLQVYVDKKPAES